MDIRNLNDLKNMTIVHEQIPIDEKDSSIHGLPRFPAIPKNDNDVSSSSSSVYSTADEDFEIPSEDEQYSHSEIVTTVKGSPPGINVRVTRPPNSTGSVPSCSSHSTSTKKQHRDKSNNQAGLPLREVTSGFLTSDGNPNKVSNNVSNVSPTPSNSLASTSFESFESFPDLNQFHPNPRKLISVLSTDEEDEFKSLDSWAPEGRSITVTQLQRVFDCFKSNYLSSEECEKLIDLLGVSQNRNDFQWALHQLGGFNALLFLYARVVEICDDDDDDIQSKGLSLALGQLKNHSRATDVPLQSHYNLLRFVLNNQKSAFGFKTFIILVHHCLTPSGNELIDYPLLDTCLLSSWKALIRVRCTDAEAPTGRRSLFECLLTVILDLLLEKNMHRAINIALLKSHKFADRLLSICCNMIFDWEISINTNATDTTDIRTSSASLSSIDALRICALVKSIFSELMAPPDGFVALAIVKYGLYPLLPKELPPLPRKEDAFFIFHHRNASSAWEADELCGSGDNNQSRFLGRKSTLEKSGGAMDNTILMNEDIPEIVGSGRTVLNNQKDYNKESFGRSQLDGFRETFQESLAESLMSVLLNSLTILPDGTFFSVLRPHLSSHLYLAYSSHSNATLKILALKLLSSYLSRVKNPCITDFLKNKGFFLASLYSQGVPEMDQIVANICQGFGPVSYPLVVGFLDSNTILGAILQWIQEDEAGTISALMSMGLIPAILNMHRSTTFLSRPLNSLISLVIRYCVLSPKEDPWKVLLCPALESAPVEHNLTSRFYQEAIHLLKTCTDKELKKGDASSRLLWLIDRSAASRLGTNFDKWLLRIFINDVMELENSDETGTEIWRYFVKKNKRRLMQAMGVYLCKVFTPHKRDFDVKQQTLKILLDSAPTLTTWLPKVLKYDTSVERCFTAFLRIFLSESTQRECSNDISRNRSPSFQALLSDSGHRLALHLIENQPHTHHSDPEIIPQEDIANAEQFQSDKAVREKFEHILVNAGILSPTNNFSTFSADFKKFKILLETPPICGVSYHELRQCLGTLEKLRSSLTPCTTIPSDSLVKAGSSGGNKGPCCNGMYFEKIFESVTKFAIEVIDRVAKGRTTSGLEIIKSVCTREEDIIAGGRWWELTEQMGHPKAPWYFPESYPKFWALDQSEGPGRVRIRLQREHLKIHNRFVLPQHRSPDGQHQPLDYLFEADKDCEELIPFRSIKTEIQYMRFCTRVIPGEEICGEIILSLDTLYFIPDSNSKTTSDPYEHIELSLSSLIHILRRRYTLEDRAAELFVGSRSLLFAFRSSKDREEFISVLGLNSVKHKTNAKNAALMDYSLTTMTSRWSKGLLSNFEYLMYLNTAAGRTYCDLMQYPIFPFVLAKYDTPTLDLHAPQSYRNLRKPMAIQDPSKEEHFLSTYNYLKRECDTAPFHYGSHYSNSGIVLHFLIRLPPYTQHFLKYQDGSFDIPDRSFHSVETAWRLASKESNTDFKEAIPEFFYLPEFLQNLQHFDFGVRQNGSRVDDVALPPWAKGDPRLFTLINRQALESNQVRKFLSDWIDLIFGFKQTGKAAVQAINVFHPSTYEGFEIEGVGDELLRRARKAMVSTYGQTPKKLIPFPHPRSTAFSTEKCDLEVLDTVWGIRWGYFLGSPTCPELEMVNTREYPNSMGLFENPTRIVFWPAATLIMGDTVVGKWNSNQIHIKSKVIYQCIGDEITTCSTTERCIWVGHQSGRISVLKLSHNLDKILETLDLVGHYKPIKQIDLNMEFSTAVSCSGEDYALMWDMNRIAFLNVIEQNSSIDSVYSSRSTGDVALVSIVANTVTLTTINGFEIGTVQPEEKVESACLSNLDPGRNVNLLAVGCDYGHVRFYSTWDLKFVNEIKVVPLASLPIHSIRYSKDGRRLYCLSSNDEVSISAALQLPDSPKI